jgi:molybdopterin-containing oxidoreductase family iron-sulfur binding subunit
MSTANQKQALVHIYNIVTGSSFLLVWKINLNQKLQSCTAIKSSWIQGVLVSGIQDKMLSC